MKPRSIVSAGSKVAATVATIGLGAVGLTYLFVLLRIANTEMGFAVMGVAGLAFYAFIALGPIGRGIGTALRGTVETPAPDHDEVLRMEELEARLSDLGAEQLRMAELEERLDFAERLLAQREANANIRGSVQ